MLVTIQISDELIEEQRKVLEEIAKVGGFADLRELVEAVANVSFNVYDFDMALNTLSDFHRVKKLQSDEFKNFRLTKQIELNRLQLLQRVATLLVSREGN